MVCFPEVFEGEEKKDLYGILGRAGITAVQNEHLVAQGATTPLHLGQRFDGR